MEPILKQVKAVVANILSPIRDPFSRDIAGLVEASETASVEVRHGDVFELRAGPVRKRVGDVTVKMLASRDEVCERVVTGVETVTETVPDPELVAQVPLVEVNRAVELVEWVCRPLLAVASCPCGQGPGCGCGLAGTELAPVGTRVTG